MVILTVINDAGVPRGEIARVEHAVQAQVNTEVRPAWRNVPRMRFGPDGETVVLVRDDGIDGENGYHLGPGSAPVPLPGINTRRPYAVVATQEGGDWPWSIAFSHETIEMLADPSGRDHRMEICDPVERFSYKLRRTWVSDFVLPAWFTGRRGRYRSEMRKLHDD